MNASADNPSFADAAKALRLFFEEVGSNFFERERLLTQLQLALLSREHLLVFGPPGTAKSQLALSVMKRIVDAQSGAPSVFSKQIAETTVQSDLVGPVDFKVLTRTGRTEHLTDEGMLGSIHGILDEVFDGREMLLRSILNLLEEREYKSGHKTTVGRTECAVMTSNRFLSEVVQRSPELMLAFADRICFVCFVPKGFANPGSRAEMLRRTSVRERPTLTRVLTIQDLDVLQAAAEDVVVPAEVLEGVERLADALENALAKAAQGQTSFRPTKYFSNRSLVKSLKVLKAAVVLDAVQRKRELPLTARLTDLGALQAFFALGGPGADELEVHLKLATDVRERAQLEAVKLETRIFTECLGQVLADLVGGAGREASARDLAPVVAAAERAADALAGPSKGGLPALAATAAAAAEKVAAQLRPPPRYEENRELLRAAMRRIAHELGGRLPAGEVGVEELPRYLEAVLKVAQLCGADPALAEEAAALVNHGFEAAQAAFEGCAHAQLAARFDSATSASVESVEKEVGAVAERFASLEQVVADLATRPDASGEAFARAAQASRSARSLCAEALVQGLRLAVERAVGPDPERWPATVLKPQCLQLAALERALRQIDPTAEPARTSVAPRHWVRLVWLLAGEVRSVAELGQKLAAASSELEAPWPLLGRLLADEVPGRIQEICAAQQVEAKGISAHPESAADVAPTFFSLFPTGPGEFQEVLALQANLGAGGAQQAPGWGAAVRSAEEADLARLAAQAGYLERWLAFVAAAETGAGSPTQKAKAALQAISETKLAQVVFEARPLVRSLRLLGELEAAGAPGAGELRVRVERLAARAQEQCEQVLAAAAGPQGARNRG